MKQVSVYLPNYTADVSGVCSALFELGGMTVIHDPSGCNSTYNTHDEPRWYHNDSLVFISGLSQMDAILGNDEKLIEDIARAVADLNPAFVALVRTPVPLMTGTDFEGIAMQIEERCHIPAIAFPTTGMQTYVKGVGMALEAVASMVPDMTASMVSDVTASMVPDVTASMVSDMTASMVSDVTASMVPDVVASMVPDVDRSGEPDSRPGLNILGATPLDLSVGRTMESLKEWIVKRGYKVQCSLAMGSSRKEIDRAGLADVSLVITAAGLPAARVLRERFGIPYVIGFPVPGFDEVLARCIEKTRRDCVSRNALFCDMMEEEREERKEAFWGFMEEPSYIIGEPVISLSLSRALGPCFGACPVVISPLETDEEIAGAGIPEGSEEAGSEEEGREGARRVGEVRVGAGSCLPRLLRLREEEEIEEAVRDAKTVVADPMYRPVCPPGCRLIPLPHEAFSGRIYRKEIPDLVKIFDTWPPR